MRPAYGNEERQRVDYRGWFGRFSLFTIDSKLSLSKERQNQILELMLARIWHDMQSLFGFDELPLNYPDLLK